MAKRKLGLGRGMDALMGEAEHQAQNDSEPSVDQIQSAPKASLKRSAKSANIPDAIEIAKAQPPPTATSF